MNKAELKKLIADVEEPLGWDIRGSSEEYAFMAAANKAFAEIKKLLKQHVEPTLRK